MPLSPRAAMTSAIGVVVATEWPPKGDGAAVGIEPVRIVQRQTGIRREDEVEPAAEWRAAPLTEALQHCEADGAAAEQGHLRRHAVADGPAVDADGLGEHQQASLSTLAAARSSAAIRSATRSSACSIPTDKRSRPGAIPAAASRASSHRRVGHGRRMRDEAFDAAEGFGEREAVQPVDERADRRFAAGKLEREQGAEAVLLACRYGVARMADTARDSERRETAGCWPRISASAAAFS